MDKTDTPTHAHASIIKTLHDLKARFAEKLEGLSETDEARIETQRLYDTIVSTLMANQQLEDASDELRCNQDEDSQEPRDS